jgi:hypothetical protein
MDPWLEHPGLWPDVHNSLIAAIRDDLAGQVAPKYFVEIKQHRYVTVSGPELLIGRPASQKRTRAADTPVTAGVGVVELDVVVPDEVPVDMWYLEVRTVASAKRVTVIEVLSPITKFKGSGRKKYLRKRMRILNTQTSLIEIDLLRDGKPMPLTTPQPVESAYRILLSRGESRPRAKLYGFGVREPIPAIPIPLLAKDPEPSLNLNAVLHALYERARFDLRLDYTKPPLPPLGKEDAAWARGIVSRRPAAV